MKKDKQLQNIIRKLVAFSFKDGKILEGHVIKSIKFLKSLPSSQVIFALSEYLKAVKAMERQYTMVVESSIPLTSLVLKRMKKIVEKKTKINKIVVNINPEILGGFKLKVGDEIYDESILGKINQMKEVISGRSNSSN